MASVAESMAAFGEACRRAAEVTQPKLVALTKALNEGVERARERVEQSRRERAR